MDGRRNIKKIAAIRPNALGDFTFVLPALQALKETFPWAEVVFLGKQWHEDFLRGRPGPVDRVVTVPPYPGVGKENNFKPDQARVDTFFSAMQQEHFNIAFQVYGGGKYSNPFTKKLGADMSVGLKTQDAEPLDVSVPYVYYQNEIMRYLEVVARVGAATCHTDPAVTVTETDIAEAEQKTLALAHKPFVVIHPGATDMRRRWPEKNFAAVANLLMKDGFHIALTGVAEEAGITASIKSRMAKQPEDLTGKLSLGGLTGLLAQAALVISNDTGPLHLADALDTPTVGLYWAGNVIISSPPTRAIHRPLMSWVVNCPLCGADCATFSPFDRRHTRCRHLVSFLTGIQTQEVIRTSLELLKKT